MSDNQVLEVNPRGQVKCSVIWLHGLGADGRDFLPIVQQMALPDELGIRFLFPNAPDMPVTINNGYVMPAWYDIHLPDLTRQVDEQGIMRSTRYLHSLVARENARGVGTDRIILAGFSQGGVVALSAALTSGFPLLGVLALSTYLPVAPASEHKLPIFLGHGRMDTVVPYPVALDARKRLEQEGHEVAWYEYDMAHSVCPAEVNDLRDWIMSRAGSMR